MNPRRMALLLFGLLFCVLALPSVEARAAVDSGWGIPVLIEDYHEGGGNLPDIAMDGDGNAFAVWNQNYGAGNSVMANRYVPDHGWLNAEMIDLGWGNTASPKVRTDGAGNAFAIWQQDDGIRTNIWACRCLADAGWQTPELVETVDDFGAFDPDIALDGDGNAVAVWTQYDGTAQSVFGSIYTEGSGWDDRKLVEEESLGDASSPALAGDGAGSFTATWIHDGGIRDNVWANRYSVGTGWGTAELIEADDVGNAVAPSVAMDASGNAFVAWYQYDGTRYNALANRFAVGVGWGSPTLIEDGEGNAESPVVAMDPEGNAFAVWRQWDGARANAMANRYAAGTGWGLAELLESDDTSSARDLRIAVNSVGAAFAVWNQYDSDRSNVWSARYVPGTGWEDAVPLEDGVGDCTTSDVGVDDDGNAIAVWGQVDADFSSMFACRYVAPDLSPPALVVTEPLPGTTVSVSSATVTGETEPGAELYVNGLLALVDGSTGEFSAVVALVEGDNEVVVTAIDAAGNSATVAITVTYEVPDDNLTALNEELSLLKESNADLLDQLNSTQDALEDLTERLDAAESDINSVPTSTLVFGVVAAAAVVLLVIMSAMYVGLRRQMRNLKTVAKEPEPPGPDD